MKGFRIKKELEVEDLLPVNISTIQSQVIINFLNEEEANKNFHYDIVTTPLRQGYGVLIDVKNLRKDFGNKTVLHDITFQIRDGESIGILGGNGAGKTTMVEILAGLNKKTSGEIDYLFEYKKSYLEEIGIQFQDSSYPPGLSVKEIIKFVLEIYGTKIESSELNALIRIFGINEYYTKHVSSLSGGQQQRLNALLALIHKPKVLFLDEISTGLDITIRTKIKKFIKEYARENGMTLVLVSHDMEELEFLVDRIIIIDKGRVVANIDKSEILEKHDSLTNFIAPYINH
ncbi:MAG: ABC transporter ATP-binding protein [Mycoplasmataceae bacterium]|nr:ABC transporter ATP-binding protein [Mycoplasmataceae bacterium]